MNLPKTPEELMERIEALEAKSARLSDEDVEELIGLKEAMKQKSPPGSKFEEWLKSWFWGTGEEPPKDGE
jgi:hypothetical protein